MADGGPGFIAALAAASESRPASSTPLGHMGEPIQVQIARVDAEPATAYVEAASCCGLAPRTRPATPSGGEQRRSGRADRGRGG